MITVSQSAAEDESPTRRPRNWWFSTDLKRGFCWSSVVGYVYHGAGEAGYAVSTLYLYTQSGIMNLIAAEADQVYRLVKEKMVKRL